MRPQVINENDSPANEINGKSYLTGTKRLFVVDFQESRNIHWKQCETFFSIQCV